MQQYNSFMEDVTDEVEFGGGWKPDPDEILVMDMPAEAVVLAVQPFFCKSV
ncbi:MAG: hypothetical protein HC888_15290 [Candidatus Competibacteraceae bacterium]|nr:hypothetical protein [Candidatus Competibacteraceae bacterium]